MSQNYRYTGVKISQYPYAELNTTNHKNKFNHDHYFMSYAATNYGISEIRKNYQVPIDAIRKDMIGYIGLSNAKAGWRDYINFWEGDWYNHDGGQWYDYNDSNVTSIDKIRSYVYQWDDIMQQHDNDYIYNKHGLQTEWDEKHDVHRVFLLKTAPWPLESTDEHFSSYKDKNLGYDPNPNSVKFVSKTYVDDRHCGVRKVDVQDYGLEHPSHLSIRPYTCFYQYTNHPEIDTDGCYYINICDDCELEDFVQIKKSQEYINDQIQKGVENPSEYERIHTNFYDKVKHNRLTFYLRIKNQPEFYYQNVTDESGKTYKNHCNNLKIKVNGVDNVVLWSYEDEWTEILREYRLKLDEDGKILNKEKAYIFIKCEAEYIKNDNKEDVFTITCSNFFGRKKAIKRMVEVPITDNGIVDIDLSLHENECFVSQIPLDELQDGQKEITRDQTVINLDVSKLDDYHVYSWDYFIITPDDTANDNKWDYNKLVFGKTPILWANDDQYNISPEFQPNKMYCVEFVKAFDGCLIGRIKYYVSLIKKS